MLTLVARMRIEDATLNVFQIPSRGIGPDGQQDRLPVPSSFLANATKRRTWVLDHIVSRLDDPLGTSEPCA